MLLQQPFDLSKRPGVLLPRRRRSATAVRFSIIDGKRVRVECLDDDDQPMLVSVGELDKQSRRKLENLIWEVITQEPDLKNHLRTKLESELAELTGQPLNLFGHETELSPELAESATLISTAEMNVIFRGQKGQRVRQLQQALTRLNSEDFGVCAICREPVGLARLLAEPTAHQCVFCADSHRH